MRRGPSPRQVALQVILRVERSVGSGGQPVAIQLLASLFRMPEVELHLPVEPEVKNLSKPLCRKV